MTATPTLDFTNLEYGIVHHLLVTAFMLQHNRYTPQAARDIAQVMQTLLETTPNEHQKQQIRQFSSGKKIIRREPAPPLRVAWTHNIGDVEFTSVEAYTRTVRAWATTTFAEFQEGEQ